VFSIYDIPVLLLAILIFAQIKKVNPFQSFVDGSKNAVEVVVGLLPHLAAMFLVIEVVVASGLSSHIATFISPAFGLVGVPSELSLLILTKPFSGSASLVILEELLKTHGADGHIGRTASVIMASSDTLFFILTVYFAKTKVKRFWLVVPIALLGNIFAAIVASNISNLL